MPKWNKNDIQQLRQLAKQGKSWIVIAKKLGRSVEAVQQKARRLGVNVVVPSTATLATTTSTQLVMPKELISVEDN